MIIMKKFLIQYYFYFNTKIFIKNKFTINLKINNLKLLNIKMKIIN